MTEVNDAAAPTPHIADLLAGAFGSLRSAIKARSIPGLRASHYRVMALIPPEGLRLTELAERAAITKAGIGQFMNYLQREGYVCLDADPADKRAKIVTLTAKGSAAVNFSLQIIADTEQRWSEALGAARYRELRHALFDIASLPKADDIANATLKASREEKVVEETGPASSPSTKDFLKEVHPDTSRGEHLD